MMVLRLPSLWIGCWTLVESISRKTGIRTHTIILAPLDVVAVAMGSVVVIGSVVAIGSGATI